MYAIANFGHIHLERSFAYIFDTKQAGPHLPFKLIMNQTTIKNHNTLL